ncbi:GNAT family N-acetyltransferase [Phytomonospora sp. NPDC050363]|uniref:GNAT family N-acetyltransferase n=1 Tax=Phytomonospora sp. NPDC050363 TaxID=3155642 RepID=UPI0033D4D916
MTVRPATSGDAPRLVALFEQLGYPSTAEAIAARLERNTAPGYRAWVFDAGDGSGPAGFAGGHVLLPWEHDDPAAQLMILVVDERRRGRGVGKALVAVFEEWARDQGAVRLLVGSGTAREKTHRFYLNRGFEQTGLRFAKRL